MRNNQINIDHKEAINPVFPASLQSGNAALFFQCQPENAGAQAKTYHYETADRDYILLDGAYYISHRSEQ